jgi:hypothetical protein
MTNDPAKRDQMTKEVQSSKSEGRRKVVRELRQERHVYRHE